MQGRVDNMEWMDIIKRKYVSVCALYVCMMIKEDVPPGERRVVFQLA